MLRMALRLGVMITSRARNRSWFRVTIYLSSDLGYAALKHL